MSEVRDTGDSTGRRIGPWRIEGELGTGGNATVYRAVRDEAEGELALKVLHKKTSKEPYQRFVREIEALRSVGSFPGILSLIDAHLPANPTKVDRAWLAMPIAVPIANAVADKPLQTVVRAVGAIASTLAGLKAAHGMAHRDIKPGNLYELDGEWLVGDFGLVAVPDVEQLTREGRQLGPAHYTAYEMIVDPTGANPFPADVYSLGKTLWVLATGQRVPPEGNQPSGTLGFSIADFRPHPHADALDRLVDITTLIHPERRPTMEQFAAELEAWSDLGSGASPLDTGDLGIRIREKMRAQLDHEDVERHLKGLGAQAVKMLQQLSRPLQAALEEVHPRPELDMTNDKLTRNLLLTQATNSSPEIAFDWQRCDRIAAGPDYSRFSLRMGRAIEVTADGELLFGSHIHVGQERVMGDSYSWRSNTRKARAGSVEAERVLQDGITELAGHLEKALAAFLEHIPSRQF